MGGHRLRSRAAPARPRTRSEPGGHPGSGAPPRRAARDSRSRSVASSPIQRAEHRARPAAQRVHLDAAVVGERRQPRRGADRDRLGERRLPCSPGPGSSSTASKPTSSSDASVSEYRLLSSLRSSRILPGFRVARSSVGPLTSLPLNTSAWSAKSLLSPVPASPRRESSSSRENGSCSAEPCSSMNRPSRDPTQFMSVSAAESSR